MHQHFHELCIEMNNFSQQKQNNHFRWLTWTRYTNMTFLHICIAGLKIKLAQQTHFIFLQREARGSVTFKIVPSYRSAPPPCEVQVSPKHQTHSQYHTASVAVDITPDTASTSKTISSDATTSNAKSVKTQTHSKDLKSLKTQKSSSKLKTTNSTSAENTPRRRLNPLSILRSRKSKNWINIG